MGTFAVCTANLILTYVGNVIVAPTLSARLPPPTAARPMTKALASEAPLWVRDIGSHATVQVASFDKHRKRVTLKCQNQVFGLHFSSLTFESDTLD
uniref:Uncharacterized protein n=1 Tax=Ixodes ricinus TaxID=34613 RepID=A0A6B0U6L8_IXORI